jgi:hypothetical protein
VSRWSCARVATLRNASGYIGNRHEGQARVRVRVIAGSLDCARLGSSLGLFLVRPALESAASSSAASSRGIVDCAPSCCDTCVIGPGTMDQRPR